jgi:transposase
MGMENITKISLAWELHQEGVPQTHIAERVDVHRITVYRWLKGIKEVEDLELFLDNYLSAKKGERKKRKIDGLLKAQICQLREDHRQCCGQKIQYFLKKDYGVDLSVTKIYEILKAKYTLRSKWKKNQKRGPVPQANAPREAVQMDTVDFGEVFAFSGIDIYTKEADVVLRPSLTGHDGLVFLKTSMERRFDGHVRLIQTDGGPEFKDEFQAHVLDYADRHRVARPYKKNEQAFIEAFNRSLRKECLGWGKYPVRELPTMTKEVEAYLRYYHEERPHIALGMKPPLEDGVLHI